MNIIVKILTFIIISLNIGSAQIFFPLKVGNIYQVEEEWLWEGPGGTGDWGIEYYFFSVVDDSVINTETFFKFSSNYGNQPLKREYWFKYDTLNQKLFMMLPSYSTPRLAADFNAQAGSVYTSYLQESPIQFTSDGISSVVALGDTHYVYSMHGSQSANNYIYRFADQIGLLLFKSYGGVSPFYFQSTHNIISAVIDSVIHNPLILSVDSLYPTFDRPVDTFPYLLNVPYTSSYSALVDSFYLDVEHIRSDTLVQTKKYNLSKSNPSHISLYLTGLLSGDKLKLRAAITDTSIYYNTDVYPDTGWVVMNILPPILNVDNGDNSLDFELTQNYPNPFNPITTIRYQIPEQTFVVISVFDILGNTIEKLVDEEKTSGSYDVEFDGTKLSSGIYYYQIICKGFIQTRKMILLK